MGNHDQPSFTALLYKSHKRQFIDMPIHQNPILSGFNPDPSIINVDGNYYMVTSTFEYFPGLPIYHSRDLISWKLIGHALTRPSQFNFRTGEPGSGCWAPTIRYQNGLFYVTSCIWTAYCPQQNVRVWPRGFYVSTTDPWKSDNWSDPIHFDQPGFDQDLFWDDDGQVYLSTCHRAIDHDVKSGLKGFAVHVVKIDLATGTSLEEPRIVRKSPSGVAEGSHIIKRGRYYYLFVAEGGTESGHSEMVFRNTRGPYGPWDEAAPNNPLISATTRDDVQNTGHADLVADESGNWWACCLAVRPYRHKTPDNGEDGFVPSPFGRETFLMEVEWKDDWPVFNKGVKLGLNFEAEPEPVQPALSWRDEFRNSKSLSLGWYHKNIPLKCEYTLQERQHHLRLRGGPYNLQSLECPTMVLRKQMFARGIWETQLDFLPQQLHCEAGTVVYWNPYTFCSIGVRKGLHGESRIIHLTRPTSTLGEFETSTCPLYRMGSVRLAIQCAETGYTLGYAEGNDDYTWVDSVSMETMTADPPKGMAFTGMMFGLYCFGELKKCLVPADFAFASFKSKVMSS